MESISNADDHKHDDVKTTNKSIFSPNINAYKNWNVHVETLNDRGISLFGELFDDYKNIEIEILSSFSTWSESPHFITQLNSILFSSPTDGPSYSPHQSLPKSAQFTMS